MPKNERVPKYFILPVMSALYIWFIILDFSRFIDMNYLYDIYPSGILKRINVALAAAIVFLASKDILSPKDSKRMKTALILACLGETAFALGERLIGLLFFALCQIVLIIRNSTGLRDKLSLANHCQKKKLLLAMIIIMLIDLSFLYVFSLVAKFSSSAIAVIIYGELLSASLLTAVGSNILGLLPLKNSRMAVGGMTCFYCCDILVGFDTLLGPGLPWLLANSFIWIFYIPALTLLALSSYSFN